jgi:dTDP-4-amino-4,6-dideoxygalactose transaminase
MYARKQLDLSYRDLGAALAFCLRPGWKRRLLESDLERLWSDKNDAVAALSVRTAFDAWLTAINLPRGSEVIASGINIPDMARILEHHDLKIVPLDLNLQTLEIRADELQEAITPKTRIVLVAHLFGARMEMDPIFEITDQYPQILVAEDCAQAFSGTDDYRGHDKSDISLFSFGSIKTATAFGGAMCRLRDNDQRKALHKIMGRNKSQSVGYFAKKALKYGCIMTLTQRWTYSLFVQACRLTGINFDKLIVSAIRGFKGNNLIQLLRQQPALPQLALLRRRLRHYRLAHLDGRCHAGNHLNHQLPASLRSAGFRNPHHTWWLFPVSVKNKFALVQELQSIGFDATASSSQLCAMTGANDPTPKCTDFMEGAVFLPVYGSVPDQSLDRMATVLRNHQANPTPVPVNEPELASMALGK